ncbi:hypothetical protein Q7P37_010580 [Cladosporium fusiforme]
MTSPMDLINTPPPPPLRPSLGPRSGYIGGTSTPPKPHTPDQKNREKKPKGSRTSTGPFHLTPWATLPPPTPSTKHNTLAGVAQSVERVALINSKEINLKVVGSSPTFGYSYITSLL